MAFTDILDSVSVGAEVVKATGNVIDSAIAGAYAAWIQSITGTTPIVVPLANNRARIDLSPDQVYKMRQWLDQQVKGALTTGEPPRVEYNLGPVLKPWAASYGLPAAVLVFLAGVATYFILQKTGVVH